MTRARHRLVLSSATEEGFESHFFARSRFTDEHNIVIATTTPVIIIQKTELDAIIRAAADEAVKALASIKHTTNRPMSSHDFSGCQNDSAHVVNHLFFAKI